MGARQSVGPIHGEKWLDPAKGALSPPVCPPTEASETADLRTTIDQPGKVAAGGGVAGVAKAHVGRSGEFGEQFDIVLPAAQSGEAWAFDILYRHFAPAVTGYLRLQGVEDPEDLANEVFLGVFRALSTFRGEEPALRSWIFSIAHRRTIDERRRRGRRVSTAPLDSGWGYESTSQGPEDEAVGALGTEEILRLCSRLAPDQRDVILLRLVSDLSVEQTAFALGKRPGAVKSLQRRALESLRRASAKEILRKGITE